MEFEKGDKPFSFFSDVFDHLPAIESVEPNELSKVVTVEASADVVFRLQDGIFEISRINQHTVIIIGFDFILYAALLMDRMEKK